MLFWQKTTAGMLTMLLLLEKSAYLFGFPGSAQSLEGTMV